MKEAHYDFWCDCLIVDGPNFWNLLKACRGAQHLFGDLIAQIEERLSTFGGRQVQFEERIWVSPRLNPRRCNNLWLQNLFNKLQHHGWQIRLAAPLHPLVKSDDDLVKYLLWERAETIPEGSILALGSGDGDFVETLKAIKAERSDLIIAVISGTFPPRFVAHPDLRGVADFFLDILTLPCMNRRLIFAVNRRAV